MLILLGIQLKLNTVLCLDLSKVLLLHSFQIGQVLVIDQHMLAVSYESLLFIWILHNIGSRSLMHLLIRLSKRVLVVLKTLFLSLRLVLGRTLAKLVITEVVHFNNYN